MEDKGERPWSLEALLTEAAGDEGLRRDLLENPMRALESRGWRLNDQERKMLQAVPPSQLRSTLEALPPKPTLLWSSEEMIGGSMPDLPLPTRGIRPDSPVKGIRPGRLLLGLGVASAALGGATLFVSAGVRPDTAIHQMAPPPSPTDAGADGGSDPEDGSG